MPYAHNMQFQREPEGKRWCWLMLQNGAVLEAGLIRAAYLGNSWEGIF